ncbi:MAG: Acetyltransferase family protein [Blastococcus sp.]|jgi:hypothetical protein|nr:Acetyltransferase family protein [Blastococcus sp.]
MQGPGAIREAPRSVAAMADVEISLATPDETEQLVAGARTAYASGLRTQRGFTEEAAIAKAVADVLALLPDGAGTPAHVFLAARKGKALVGGVRRPPVLRW